MPQPNRTITPTLSVQELSDLLGVGIPRIQQLVISGVVIKDGRGSYRLWESVKGYINFQRGRIANRDPDPTIPTDGPPVVSAGSYETHRARLYKARADKAELEARRVAGELHHAEDVRRYCELNIANARAKLLAAGSKLAPKLIEITDLTLARATIDEELRNALTELTDYDPSKLAGAVIPANQPDVEAAAEDDGEPMG